MPLTVPGESGNKTGEATALQCNESFLRIRCDIGRLVQGGLELQLLGPEPGQAMHNKSYRCKWLRTVRSRGWRPGTIKTGGSGGVGGESAIFYSLSSVTLIRKISLKWRTWDETTKCLEGVWLRGKAGVKVRYGPGLNLECPNCYEELP